MGTMGNGRGGETETILQNVKQQKRESITSGSAGARKCEPSRVSICGTHIARAADPFVMRTRGIYDESKNVIAVRKPE